MTDLKSADVLAALRMDPPADGKFFEDGDVAIVLKNNGEVRAMSFGIAEQLRGKAVSSYTDADLAALQQGEKLLALSMAAQNPQLMAILLAVVHDPDVVQSLMQIVHPN